MPKSKSAIHVILTGGTIDSHYDGTKDAVVPNKHSVIPRYLGGLKLPQQFIFSELRLKDSRSLTTSDLKNILRTVARSPADKIIITHGTYTMADTARFLQANLASNSSGKVIVFTGAFIPLDGFNFSDSAFNLGFALAQVLVLDPGIYIAMNGKVLAADAAMKIIFKGKFVSIFGDGKNKSRNSGGD